MTSHEPTAFGLGDRVGSQRAEEARLARRTGAKHRRDGGGPRRSHEARGKIIAAARVPGATAESIKAAMKD